jgi:hypothetical protein
MQQGPSAAPSATFNVVIGAVLGFIGSYDMVSGITRDGAGVFLCGLALALYAALLLRDAWYLKKTGRAALTRVQMNRFGLACLALYVLGVLVKRLPELAAFLRS